MSSTVETLTREPVDGDATEGDAEETINPLGELAREYHFPTAIYYRDFADAAELNAAVLPRIRELREQDSVGERGSHVRELGGWHSHDKLRFDPVFDELTARIQTTVGQICDDAGYHPEYEVLFDNMWAIINPPGSYNQSHVHPRCLWSGVYYVQVPEESGRISFADPRLGKIMMDPRFDPERRRKPEHWVEVFFRPRPGRLIVFPSWLYHAVEANRSEAEGEAGERVIVSFNFFQRQ